MPHDRFFLDAPLELATEVQLEDEEMRHLLVMRPKLEEEIELVNGKGTLAKGVITSIQKRIITLEIKERIQEEQDPFSLIIAQGIPRASRLDTILEKGTELGLSEIWLFAGERSEKTTFSNQQNERMQKILIAAMKQSGRLYLPKIELHPPISKWTTLPEASFYGAFKENTLPFMSAWQKAAPKNAALFLVGPESGLSPKEEAHLDKLHAMPVSLHKNILRTDTAPLAALTLMHTFSQHLKEQE